MKIRITYKDPDALQDCIKDALADLTIEGVNDEEMELIREKRQEEIAKMCGKWFEWGEYLNVEVDTEKETIKVLLAEE